jgi:tRNA G18 (ribose-2'-O)-methylase SpoU
MENTDLNNNNKTINKNSLEIKNNENENINKIKKNETEINQVKKPFDFYLLIYNIAKKHNIGTLIRSASAFNIKKVLVLGENKKILKKFFGSQGTVKKTEFLFFNDIKSIKDFCKENEIYICGIEIGGESKPVQTQPFKGNTLFILGNEGSGMNYKQKEMCDHLVYIPQYSSKTGSLNVAIAASIIFHHFAVWANYPEATFTEEKYDVEFQKGNVEIIETGSDKNKNDINELIDAEILREKVEGEVNKSENVIVKDDIHKHHAHKENAAPLDNLIEDFQNL